MHSCEKSNKTTNIVLAIRVLLLLALVFLEGYLILGCLPKVIAGAFALSGLELDSHDLATKYRMGIAIRILGIVSLLPFFKYLNVFPTFSCKINKNCFALSWIFFIYIVANLEIENIAVANPWLIVLMILECLAIGFYEELLFRGLLLSQFTELFGKRKSNIICAVLASSFVFGLFHLGNLRSGVGLETVLFQIGYASIMGVAFSALLLRTNWNILWCSLVHAFYDIASGFGDFSVVQSVEGSTLKTQSVTIYANIINLCLFLPLLLYALFLLRKVKE